MRLLYQDATEASATCLRVGIYGVWCAIILMGPVRELGALPLSLFEPDGFLKMIPPVARAGLVNENLLTLFCILTASFLVLAALGIWFRFTALAGCIFLTVHEWLLRSFGWLGHAQIPLLLTAYALCGFAWADEWDRRFGSGRDSKPNYFEYPLVTAVGILCLSYSFVGVHRLIYGGLEVYLSDSILYWFGRHEIFYSTGLAAGLLTHEFVGVVLRAGFFALTMLEVLAPLCLLSGRFRVLFLCGMIPFHVLSVLIMNTLFWENMLLLILLVDINRFFVRPADLRLGS